LPQILLHIRSPLGSQVGKHTSLLHHPCEGELSGRIPFRPSTFLTSSTSFIFLGKFSLEELGTVLQILPSAKSSTAGPRPLVKPRPRGRNALTPEANE
jgi:hypothetical protein